MLPIRLNVLQALVEHVGVIPLAAGAECGWRWQPRPSLSSSSERCSGFVPQDPLSRRQSRSISENGQFRVEKTPLTQGQPLELSHLTRHLVLDLPIGSKEGNYEVALGGGGGQQIRSTTGIAQFENHTVILRATSIWLEFRQVFMSWGFGRSALLGPTSGSHEMNA